MKLVQSVNDFLANFMTESDCLAEGIDQSSIFTILAKSVLLLNSLL